MPPALVDQLRNHLGARRIRDGFTLLDFNRDAIERIGPGTPQSAMLTGYIAQWVDAGYSSHALIRTLLARFPERSRARLSVEEFAHLRMAEAIVCLSAEDVEKSMDSLQVILSLEAAVEDRELVAMAHFGRARCLRRKGEYGKAYQEAVTAREITAGLGLTGLANVIATLEGWILFRKGKLKEAATVLYGAERELEGGDDLLTLGNIQSAFGRIAQHQGQYEHAMERYRNSIDYFRRHDPEHPNLARSLANMAYVERLVSLQLKRRIDSGAGNRTALRERFERIRTSALSHLQQAGAVFLTHDQHHGEGTVAVNSGFLHLDAGEFDKASTLAAEAFTLGHDKEDTILMARARQLQSAVELARAEEGLEGDDPEQHIRAALEHAKEAIEYAKRTEHSRLLARGYLALGAARSSEFLNDMDNARACCDTAASLLKSEGVDPLLDEVRALRARIAHSGTLEATLRAWAQGEVGGKTLQQLTEDFCEFIIPRIWQQENKKISRVAARLSVSPKKVRRILGRAGLLRP